MPSLAEFALAYPYISITYIFERQAMYLYGIFFKCAEES